MLNNAQAAVDGDGQLVVGTPVMDNASDQGRLPEMFGRGGRGLGGDARTCAGR